MADFASLTPARAAHRTARNGPAHTEQRRRCRSARRMKHLMGMPYDGAPTDVDQEELGRFKMGPVRTIAASLCFGIAARFCFRVRF